MKTRNGFVSNSSSSSFVVSLNDISKRDMDVILEYPNTDDKDSWNIYIKNNSIHGFCSMDNNDLTDYLNKNNVYIEKFEWEDY